MEQSELVSETESKIIGDIVGNKIVQLNEQNDSPVWVELFEQRGILATKTNSFQTNHFMQLEEDLSHYYFLCHK